MHSRSLRGRESPQSYVRRPVELPPGAGFARTWSCLDKPPSSCLGNPPRCATLLPGLKTNDAIDCPAECALRPQRRTRSRPAWNLRFGRDAGSFGQSPQPTSDEAESSQQNCIKRIIAGQTSPRLPDTVFSENHRWISPSAGPEGLPGTAFVSGFSSPARAKQRVCRSNRT